MNLSYAWSGLSVISVVLVSSLFSSSSNARTPANQEERLVVTGSLLKRADENGPAPILSLSIDDIARMGHTNLYQALMALTAQTGSIAEGDQFPNGFTSAAQPLNLRGFGPGRTLVLVNGQRLALNPTPYQSEANFFNFAIIPIIAVERIDVLTDGASAIYGSDAIAGVINIILRDDYDADELSVLFGDTTQGGGSSKRVMGGNTFRSDTGFYTLGYQFDQQDPFFGNQREAIDSYLDFPQLFFPPAIAQFDEGTGSFVLPSLNACDQHPELELSPFGYCGRDSVGDASLRNQRDSQSVYFRAEWDLGEVKAFSNLLAWQAQNESRSFRREWQGIYAGNDGNGNWDGGALNLLLRAFSPAETGDQDNRIDERTVSLLSGLSGSINQYDYQVQFTHSEYETEQRQTWVRAEGVESFFIDPVGYIDLNGNFLSLEQFEGVGIPIIGDPAGNIFQRFQPSQLGSVFGNGDSDSKASSTNLSFQISGESFFIGEHATEFAVIAEWNRTDYRIDVDDTTANFGWFNVGGSSGRGDRGRLAVGTEWFFPVLSDDELLGDLSVTLAARWDDYRDRSAVGDATTWKAALQWDVSDQVTFRSTHSTSFRAPDLHYLNADNTRYFTLVTDVLECIQTPFNSFDTCRNNPDFREQVTVNWQGSQDLEEEKGRTQTLGMVYQPSANTALNIDFYDIKLTNQVGLQVESQLLLWEAQCQLGANLISGTVVDSDSDVCDGFVSRVNRFESAPSVISSIDNLPVNRAFRQQRGVDLRFSHFTDPGEYGQFGMDLQYSHIFETKIQEIASEPTSFNANFRDDPANGEIRSRTNLTLSWGGDRWRSALSFFRRGSRPTSDGSSRISPWTTANFVLSHSFENRDELRFIVRNLTDEKPPLDLSLTRWPFFNRGQYDAIGTEWFLEARWQY